MIDMAMTIPPPPLSSDSEVLVSAGPSVTCDGQSDSRLSKPNGGVGAWSRGLWGWTRRTENDGGWAALLSGGGRLTRSPFALVTKLPFSSVTMRG